MIYTEMTEHQKQSLHEQSRLATASLVMVSVHARFSKNRKIHAYYMPWECLSAARELFALGAKTIHIFHSGTEGMWYVDEKYAKYGT